MRIPCRVIVVRQCAEHWGVPPDRLNQMGKAVDEEIRNGVNTVTIKFDDGQCWYVPEDCLEIIVTNKYNPTNYVPRFERLPLP